MSASGSSVPRLDYTASVQAHEKPVLGLDVTRNCNWVATCSKDYTVCVWELQKRTRVLELRGHNLWVRCCCFSPDDKLLASASDDQTVLVWDLATGEAIDMPLHAGSVNAMRFARDGRTVATACADNSVRVWNATTRELVGLCGGKDGHTAPVYGVDYSCDGVFLASAGGDRAVRVWDAHSRQPITQMFAHTKSVACCRFAAEHANMLVSGSADGSARLWDLRASRCVASFEGGATGAALNAAALVAGNELLATGSADGYLALWDVRAVKCVGAYRHSGAVNALIVSSDGGWVGTGCQDGSLRLFPAKAPAPTGKAAAVRPGAEQLEDECAALEQRIASFRARSDEQLQRMRADAAQHMAALDSMQQESTRISEDVARFEVRLKETTSQARADVAAMRKRFEDESAAARAAFEEERERLRNELADRERLLEEARARMPEVMRFVGDKISLNVGGTKIQTTLSVLRSDPDSLLANMFSGQFKVEKDESGSYFLDRDGSTYKFIVNFLRDADKATFPDNLVTLREIAREADYLQLRKLTKAVNARIIMASANAPPAGK